MKHGCTRIAFNGIHLCPDGDCPRRTVSRCRRALVDELVLLEYREKRSGTHVVEALLLVALGRCAVLRGSALGGAEGGVHGAATLGDVAHHADERPEGIDADHRGVRSIVSCRVCQVRQG